MENLKLFLKSFMVVLLTLLVMTIAGCKKDSSNSSVKVENLGTPNNPTPQYGLAAVFFSVHANTIGGDVNVFKVYARPESAAYQSFKTIKRIESKYNIPGLTSVPVRVELLEDGDIHLTGTEYDMQADSYKFKNVYFSTGGKKGDVFEFDVVFTEGMPQAIISVNTEPLAAYYLVQESGVDGLPDGTIVKGSYYMP